MISPIIRSVLQGIALGMFLFVVGAAMVLAAIGIYAVVMFITEGGL